MTPSGVCGLVDECGEDAVRLAAGITSPQDHPGADRRPQGVPEGCGSTPGDHASSGQEGNTSQIFQPEARCHSYQEPPHKVCNQSTLLGNNI